jgi:hypothetical protein
MAPSHEPAPEALFHFSDDSDISVFKPHVPATNPAEPPGVYALDRLGESAYWFPRHCPRVCVWSLDGSPATALGPTRHARVHVIERRWRDDMATTTLWRYRFAPAGFEPWVTSDGTSVDHQWIARQTVRPLDVEAFGDLPQRHLEAGIELRAVDDLRELVDTVVSSGLRFSMIRMRNAGGQ